MSHIALYEKGEGRETLRLNQYYRHDLDRSNSFRSIPRGILSFVLIIGLTFAADKAWFVDLCGKIGTVWAAILMVLAFLVFVFIYCIYSTWMFRNNYDDYRGHLNKYDLNLKRLDAIYEKEKSDKENALGNTREIPNLKNILKDVEKTD